ncbi:uncharacterized protein LOC127798414 [Diospyros lotus]|uniref:uncharacterized protein LOC127798414 n=1 Tax=Diospyros lotus TaxID=55363 RepID=UPI00225B029B|nr:uncharacterized protein LOC127798414 [Diospyros lotus]
MFRLWLTRASRSTVSEEAEFWLTLKVIADGKEFDRDVSKSPWGYVAENVQQDLLSSFQNVRKAMESKELEGKPTLVAGFGKILFHGVLSIAVYELQVKRNVSIFDRYLEAGDL